MKIPDDPRISHGGGQDDVQCPECNGEGRKPLSQCCGGEIESDGDFCPLCKERAMLVVCEDCEGRGSIDGAVLRKRQAAERAEYLADFKD